LAPLCLVGQRVKEPVDLTGCEQRRLESSDITTRRILYWLAAMVAVLVAGTIIGLIWADTSNVAGSIAVATNIIGVVGIASLLIALVVKRRRRRT
jgi:membrane protein YdbS with pleckstrin-like domain